jgi:superfamily II DNA or RNA helicase
MVTALSEATIKTIRAMSPKDRPDFREDPVNVVSASKWVHQAEAVEAFCTARHGVLEMATGTGKTKTALLIADKLLAERKISGFIVSVNGTDLLDQWSKQLVTWAQARRPPLTVLRQYESHYQAQTYALHPAGRILVISRQQLVQMFHLLPVETRSSLLIIHDEVHGLGAPSLRNDIPGENVSFAYRLGLSATPERDYDAAGSKFIESEIGPVVYRFTIEDAIRKGILSEFTYIPLEYALTDEDRRRLKAVYTKKAARKLAGNPMSDEELWTEIARVYKTAAEKPSVFANYLIDHQDVLKRSIIFVEEMEYGSRILPIISNYTHNYRTYYAEDDRAELIRFADNEIDCLITCHRISQGIDIQNLRVVILFASARSRLETIQRIGRVLRIDPTDPNKRAVVIDFVRRKNEEDGQYPSADEDRASWLTELSKVKRSADSGP